MEASELPPLIDQAIEIAGNDFDLAEGFDFRTLSIIREFDPALGPVPVIGNELEQVLLNLLKNAAQAIHLRDDEEEGEYGRITLRTKLRGGWPRSRWKTTASASPRTSASASSSPSSPPRRWARAPVWACRCRISSSPTTTRGRWRCTPRLA